MSGSRRAMSRKQLAGEFARLARENARKARYWKREGYPSEAEWFGGRSNAYITAARILRGVT
jgi:hypothetical protein